MSLFFLRHGNTYSEAYSEGLFDDISVSDASRMIPLSESGKIQVETVVLPDDIDVIVISDSLRTRQTAEILQKKQPKLIPIVVESDLYPWDSGAKDWKTYWKRYYNFATNYSPNAGYETKESMRARLEKVLSKYANQNALIIAHSVLLSNYIGRDYLDYCELIQIN